MISVLQREFAVRYNVEKMDTAIPLSLEDTFIHGIIQGQGGTCGSLPVLYAAVGRRLGYPLKLVSAHAATCGHCFARWDEPGGERFNIEVNATGLNCPADDDYRRGEYSRTLKNEHTCCLLQSQGPRDELASFLDQRGFIWVDHHRYVEALKCFAWASSIAPQNKTHARNVVDTFKLWDEQLAEQRLPCKLIITFPHNGIPNVPAWVVKKLVSLETLESLQKDPDLHPVSSGKDSMTTSGCLPHTVHVQYPAVQFLKKC